MEQGIRRKFRAELKELLVTPPTVHIPSVGVIDWGLDKRLESLMRNATILINSLRSVFFGKSSWMSPVGILMRISGFS